MQYLVEMRLVPSARPTSPEVGIALVENYIFPTLEMCTKLRESARHGKRGVPTKIPSGDVSNPGDLDLHFRRSR